MTSCASSSRSKAQTLSAEGLFAAQGIPYPYFESFALIDDQGQQVSKWVTAGGTPMLINVGERLYFQRIHQGIPLKVPEPGPEAVDEDEPSRFESLQRWAQGKWYAGIAKRIGRRIHPLRPPAREPVVADEPFFLESVQSWTNGKWQAVIAKPVDPKIKATQPSAQVAALAIQMLSVINPVMPAGFEFAVVGDDGTVLFHSDSARNRAENFFEETEHDRRFKSIVFARHDEPFNVRYWGESYRAVAIPVKGLPWTIVAMRNQQVLERVNLDWLVTTLVFVLLYTGAITLALIAIALLRPGYRAGWAWPDPKRRHDYAELIAIFAIFCLAFLTALFGLRGTGRLFAVAGLLPMLSLVAAYLKLSPDGNRKTKQRAAAASGLLLLALLGLALYKAPMESGADFLGLADGLRSRRRRLPAGGR